MPPGGLVEVPSGSALPSWSSRAPAVVTNGRRPSTEKGRRGGRGTGLEVSSDLTLSTVSPTPVHGHAAQSNAPASSQTLVLPPCLPKKMPSYHPPTYPQHLTPGPQKGKRVSAHLSLCGRPCRAFSSSHLTRHSLPPLASRPAPITATA